MKQLFVDLDGVLADFDGHYEACFGIRPDRGKPEPPDFWQRLADKPDFFESMPVMRNGYDLWFALKRVHANPIILTGCPKSMPSAADQKRSWVRRHFGLVNVITCMSKDKWLYAKPGDVLLDDWWKYSNLWEQAGGTFILYPGFGDYLNSIVKVTIALG